MRAIGSARQLLLGRVQPLIQRAMPGRGQLDARRMRGRFFLPGDHRQKAGAETLQLGRANAGDGGEIVQRGGAALGHLDQRAVVEDNIGRHLGGLRQFTAMGLQRCQHRRVIVRYQGARLGPAGHAQRAIAIPVRAHQITAHHLPEHRLPGRALQVLTNREGWQKIVAALAHLVGGVAGQDVDQMVGAEAFAGAQHRRQRLAHGFRRVEQPGRGLAQIAIAAGIRDLPEIRQQHAAAAGGGLGQAQKRIQPPVIGLAPVGGRIRFVDLGAAQPDVIGAEQGQRIGR